MNSLGKRITPSFLLKFTLPAIIMMVFNSIYTMVDGGFVSNFVGTGALSAINIVYPVVNLVFAIGIMLATGGSAIVAKQMGEENPQTAKENFTFLLVCGALTGVVITAVSLIFTKPIVLALGANEAIYQYCYDYILYLSPFIPFSILQIMFQFFFSTAGKPHLGLVSTVIGGVSNILLDYVFIVPMNMGIKGAAIATGIGFVLPVIIGLFYFSGTKKRILHFAKPVFRLKTLGMACGNGSSEMVSNLSVAVTTFLFNRIMMRYLGEDGVAAMTIVFYAQFLFTAVYFGYTSGAAPLISYNYGAGNKDNLNKLFRLSMIFTAVCSGAAYLISIAANGAVVGLFAKPGTQVFELAYHGMKLFAIGFLAMGFNIFASGLFTALSNGKVSALLSFLRTFVFILLAILILPSVFEVNGIWLAIPVAEGLALIAVGWYFIKFKKVYGAS